MIESLDDEPDAKRQLPKELWGGRERLHKSALLDDPKYHGDCRSHEHGPPMSPSMVMPLGTSLEVYIR